MKILFISASGIGNFLMLTPTIKLLKKRFPHADIDLIIRRAGINEILSRTLGINTCHLADSLPNLLSAWLRILSRRYDYSITAFPSNKWQFNILAFLLGAKKRITHGYSVCALRSLSFLQNVKIMAKSDLHDVENNLRLLEPFGIKPAEKGIKLEMGLRRKDVLTIARWCDRHQIIKKDHLIAVHPGSSVTYGHIHKRAPIEEYARICKERIQKRNAKVIIVGSPEEKEVKEDLLSRIDSQDASLFEGSLGETAVLIQRCKEFYGNDSGLMHIAVAAGVKTTAYFSVTNPTRTRPYGKKHTIIVNDQGFEYTYPFKSCNSDLPAEIE